ncbi:unnamed protein product [Soboliphyme baturini]|uniref:Ribonuclease H2 subunit C n=1 Tax=Soboliphyme baturini TaxID=241478 RepID=A0A183J7Z8_9BILA|nr:unnamed protein product [Soboliphyme baturini]
MAKRKAPKNARIHYIPAAIKHDGHAQVEKYFECSRLKAADGSEHAMLRGRGLCGMTLRPPQGYKIFVTQPKQPLSEQEDADECIDLRVLQTADDFTYWNWDKQPTSMDAVQKAFEWIDVASALCNSDGEKS